MLWYILLLILKHILVTRYLMGISNTFLFFLNTFYTLMSQIYIHFETLSLLIKLSQSEE